MAAVAGELLIVLALIVANGFFAMSEIAIVSARRARLQQWADEGRTRARAALHLADSPDRFLATVQVGITLIAVFTGAFGGYSIARELAGVLERLALPTGQAQALALGIVVVGITFLTLVVGELAPKSIGLNNAEGLAVTIAPLMTRLCWLASPVVAVLNGATRAVLWVLRVREARQDPVDEDELRILVAEGTRAGVFEQVEQGLIDSVLRLDQKRVGRLMTPRNAMVWLDATADFRTNLERVLNSRHSRYPVCQGDIDRVTGIVRAVDILKDHLEEGASDLQELLAPPPFVVESMTALDVLKAFQSATTHMAIVVDEYGAVEGLVTLDEVLEAIVGDEVLAEEDVEELVVQRADGSWLCDGLLPIDEFIGQFAYQFWPDAENQGYDTVGGFVMAQLARIPRAGDVVMWHDIRIEVMDMDGHRVDKVLVTPADS